MDKHNYKCTICNNKGWIETIIFDSKKGFNGTIVIEKCDECNIFLNDSVAAKFAFKHNNVISVKLSNMLNLKILFSSN